MAAGGAEQAETYLRLLAEAELRRAPVFPGPGSQPHRVALAATALVSAGAISLDTAWWVVADFQAACALRTGGSQMWASTGSSTSLIVGSGESSVRPRPRGSTRRRCASTWS